jgi:hypothetical protein
MWYKAEANIASEFAGKILYDNDLTPIYVSDNPVLNAQHVVFEAAKGYRYGLPYHAALAAVTTAPAERLGFGNRLGKIKSGFDADVVVWDSDPLSVGAAPVQVWIDGTAQFEDPVELKKPAADVMTPDEDLSKIPEGPVPMDEVAFTGVSKVFLRNEVRGLSSSNAVIVSKGKVTCIGSCVAELEAAAKRKIPTIHLKDGYLTESFTAFGSKIGLSAIDAEKDTDNGPSGSAFTRAEDGLALDTQKTNASYTYGVTKAISAPRLNHHDTHHGTSVGFLTGALTPLSKDAIFATDAAVHYTLTPAIKSADNTPSLSAAIGALRTKLLTAASTLNTTTTTPESQFSETSFLHRVLNASLALVITTHSADTIAALLKLKQTIEATTHTPLRLVIHGGAEAHLLAADLAAASVPVILAPLFSYAAAWDQRRALTGAPLTNGTGVDGLVAAGVKVAIGLEEDWVVRDLGLLAGWVCRNAGGRVGEREALGMVGRNLYEMLGVQEPGAGAGHAVVWEGSPLGVGGRVRGVAGGRGVMDVWS